MDGDQLGSVRKRPLDLDFVDHFGNAFHDRVGWKNGRSEAHDLGDRTAVANQFEDFRGDEGHSLRMIQLETARTAFARQLAGRKDQQFVDFSRREVQDDSDFCLT